jgi:DNA-binding GntR family transcriptional regulator
MKFFENPYDESNNAATLASSLTARIKLAILCGDLAPCSKLHLDNLRSRFGVSLSPLREALSRLSREGLVQVEDQRGYRVAPVSEHNLRELVFLRAEFECLALRESIKNGDLEWEGNVLSALHRIRRIDRSKEHGGNQEAWENAHRNFHLQLVAAGNMPLLLQLCSMLNDLVDRYRRIFLARNSADPETKREHTVIAEAAVAREKDLAIATLRSHIERTGNRIMKGLREQLGGDHLCTL